MKTKNSYGAALKFIQIKQKNEKWSQMIIKNVNYFLFSYYFAFFFLLPFNSLPPPAVKSTVFFSLSVSLHFNRIKEKYFSLIHHAADHKQQQSIFINIHQRKMRKNILFIKFWYGTYQTVNSVACMAKQ